MKGSGFVEKQSRRNAINCGDRITRMKFGSVLILILQKREERKNFVFEGRKD